VSSEIEVLQSTDLKGKKENFSFLNLKEVDWIDTAGIFFVAEESLQEK
jgi:hypothetical protein